MEQNIFSNQKAWVITVDMGYGHQRTSDNLKHLSSDEKVICANNYDGMPIKDRKIWQNQRKSYEAISAFKRVPLVGNLTFAVFDFLILGMFNQLFFWGAGLFLLLFFIINYGYISFNFKDFGLFFSIKLFFLLLLDMFVVSLALIWGGMLFINGKKY